MLNEKRKVVYTCFPGGKHKVLTMSYDDGREEDRRLVEIFNKNGIKGTFHLNAGIEREIKPEEFAQVYKGHEVSCHTYQHPTIARCPKEDVLLQVLQDRSVLEAAVGYPVRGLSYPNGSYNSNIIDMLPSVGIKYSRTVNSTGTFAMPANYLEWNPTCHHNHNIQEKGKEFLALFKRQYLYMMYVWGHSYEFTDKNNWEVMENFCELMGRHEDIWYATNIEIVDYMEAAERLQFSVNQDFVYNPSAISVWIEVDKAIVEIGGGQTVSL